MIHSSFILSINLSLSLMTSEIRYVFIGGRAEEAERAASAKLSIKKRGVGRRSLANENGDW
jgi:hypothetical protein